MKNAKSKSERRAKDSLAEAAAPDPDETKVVVERVAPEAPEPIAMPPESRVAVEACRPHADNRDVADDPDIEELALSMRVVGQLSPIHVAREGDGLRIVSGERRWRAARACGWREVRAYVHEELSELRTEQIRLIENQQRREPSAFDIAVSLRRMKNRHGLTHEQLAARTATRRATITGYLGIFNASDRVIETIAEHRLAITVAVALCRFERSQGEVAARRLIPRVVAESLSARDIDGLRKRKRGAKAGAAAKAESGANAKASKGPRDPWTAVARQLERLIARDPAGAPARLEALRAKVDQALARVRG
jgi:ParB family chromosome partitioning protein